MSIVIQYLSALQKGSSGDIGASLGIQGGLQVIRHRKSDQRGAS